MNADSIKKKKRGPKPGSKLIKTETVAVKTSPLMGFLAGEAHNRGEGASELAAHLGIGYVYLTQLLRGVRPVDKLGRQAFINAAKYLNVPVAQIYLWAGALEPTDFINDFEFEVLAGDAHDIMSRHTEWGGFTPHRAEWDLMPESAKVMIMLLFERVTGISLTKKTIIDQRNTHPSD